MIKYLMLVISVITSGASLFNLDNDADPGIKLLIVIFGLAMFEIINLLEKIYEK